MNILEERGTFWWANEPKEGEQPATPKDTSGVLKVTDKGKIFLDLDGILLPAKERGKTIVAKGASVNLEGKIICGFLSEKNQYVYLSDLWGGFLFSQFQVGACLVGRNKFPPGATLPTISKIGITLEGYEDWFCLKPIELTEKENEISFTYKALPEDIYKLPSADIRITYHPIWHCGDKADITPAVYLKYLPQTPLSFQEATKKFHIIEDLLIILTGAERTLNWPNITLAENDSEYTCYFRRHLNDVEGPSRYDTPTNFVLLRDDFGRVFSLWEEKFERLGSAFYSYLGTKRGIMYFIEDLFRNLVGGLEAFHRKTTPSSVLTDRQRVKLDRMLERLHAKDKGWAKDILKRAHIDEPSLEVRLFEIFNRLRPDLDKNRLRIFAKQCSDDRNELSHFAGQREAGDNTVLYTRLGKASYALSYFYHALILSEIGVKQEIIDDWALNSFSSNRIKRALIDLGLVDEDMIGDHKSDDEQKSVIQR